MPPRHYTEERREYQRDYQRKRRIAKSIANLCVMCNAPAVEGKKRCAECTAKERQAGLSRRAQFRVQSSCVICGQPVRSSRMTCAECINREKKRCRRFRTAALDHYGRRCACCGEAEPMFL